MRFGFVGCLLKIFRGGSIGENAHPSFSQPVGSRGGVCQVLPLPPRLCCLVKCPREWLLGMRSLSFY